MTSEDVNTWGKIQTAVVHILRIFDRAVLSILD